MRLTNLLSAFNRRTRWSEGHIFSVTPEQIGIAEGFRASFAIAAMLALDLQFQIPDLAYGGVAAFWTCLCDPGGSDRARLRTLLIFAFEATLVISAAAFFAGFGKLAAGAGLFLLVLICGLTRSYRPTFGPMPAPIGLISAIAAVIGVTSPRGIGGALHLAGCFLAGALWALVLCVYLWRTHPRAPARRALTAVFGRLRDMGISLRQLDVQSGDSAESWSDFNVGHRRAVRFSIERGREIVARLMVGRARFAQGVDAAGRVFAALMALGHYRSESGQSFDPVNEAPLLDELNRLLDETAQQSGLIAPAPEPLAARSGLLLASAEKSEGIAARAIASAARALHELALHWREPEPADLDGDMAAGRFSLKIPATVWRHALRVAVAVTISFTFGAWYEVSFSYWGTIATLVLMQPFGTNTWLRVIERAAGSIVGGVLAAILIARLSGPWEMLIFIGPLTVAVIALRLVNYGLFVVFVTPMFILVSDFIHPASDLIVTRAINEIIGACIGLAGSLVLWPEKETGALSDQVLAALSANLAFAAGALRSPVAACGELDQLRRDAGLASGRAEIARQRLMLLGRSRAARLDRVGDILLALRSICGAANVWLLTRRLGPETCEPARADRYDGLAQMLRAEFLGSEAANRAAESAEGDELDRAIHSLALAVRDYSTDRD